MLDVDVSELRIRALCGADGPRHVGGPQAPPVPRHVLPRVRPQGYPGNVNVCTREGRTPPLVPRSTVLCDLRVTTWHASIVRALGATAFIGASKIRDLNQRPLQHRAFGIETVRPNIAGIYGSRIMQGPS